MSLSLKDVLCQVWLKLTQWFCRRFVVFVNVFFLFHNYLPLKKGVVFYLNKPEFSSPKHDKFHWNCPRASGEEDFQILSMYFRYFLISPLENGRFPSFEQTWILFTQGCFVPSLVEIGLVVLDNFFYKFQCVSAILLSSPLERGHNPLFEQSWIPFT